MKLRFGSANRLKGWAVHDSKERSRHQCDLGCREHMNVVFIGHVDAGKSTTGGQILYLTVSPRLCFGKSGMPSEILRQMESGESKRLSHMCKQPYKACLTGTGELCRGEPNLGPYAQTVVQTMPGWIGTPLWRVEHQQGALYIRPVLPCFHQEGF